MSSSNRGAIDPRGYIGAQKNRKLSPQEVMWAREEYFHGRVSSGQLAHKYGMGADSVRRMLRGDTYSDVGMALPRAEEVDAVLRQKADDGGIAERVMEFQRQLEAQGAKVTAVEPQPAEKSAIDVFLESGPQGDPFAPQDD